MDRTEQSQPSPPRGMKKEWKTRGRGKTERRGHNRIEQNRDPSPPVGEARMKNRVGSATQLSSKTGSHVDPNSDPNFDPFDPKFDQKRDLVLIRILTPTLIQNGIQV